MSGHANPQISAHVRQYLADFSVTAIAVTQKGRIVLSDNPAGHAQAFWLKKQDAEPLLAEARTVGNIERAAKQLHISITPHHLVLMKTDRALGRIDQVLLQAQNCGHLQQFNQMYRRKRLEALANGVRYMGFGTAQLRLRRALAAAVASGCQGKEFEFALRDVFK